MRATRLELRDFRNFARAAVTLAPELTVVSGPNGAGKSNLLEAICFACTGRSPRTANERELVRRGRAFTRIGLHTQGDDGAHRVELGFKPGEPKRVRIDGRAAELATAGQRPLVSVFMPQRLELVRGAPAPRRAHLDRLVAALWPARAQTRVAYSRALAQRNALLARIRARVAGTRGLDAWDAELARHGACLTMNRAEAIEALRVRFAARAGQLGLSGPAEIRYRPRGTVGDARGLAAELATRRAADIERGFTVHGPHRDDVQLLLDGASLRSYGSQGQQRVALLALLFAERALLAERRARPPLMLLDDVMSELDAVHRSRLGELLSEGGQAILTTADAGHVPGADAGAVALVEVRDGRVEMPTPAGAAP